MEPLTAIGLASNILSFIDFGARVVSSAIEIYKSDASGITEERRNTEAVVTEMRYFASKMQPPDDAQLTGDEKALCALAKECHGLAAQIIALVEKVKPKPNGQKSMRASMLAAVKTRWYESDSRKLEGRLGDCRAQLDLQLNHLTSSDVKSRLADLIASARDDSSKLERLSGQVDDLRRGVELWSLSPSAQDQLRRLLGISEHAGDLITTQRFLASLYFDGMYRRYEDVSEAHSETLRWIFGDDTVESIGSASSNEMESSVPSPAHRMDEPKAAAKAAFLAWLSSGDGIFHISGKLGSGKSTLMKFLCEHESTVTMLNQWAVPRRLVFASFFFWKPGSGLQSSLTGLYRSLLHDVLQASPEIIPDVLPDHWQQAKSTPWQAMSKIRFSDRDIREAFSRLISDASLYKNHCFCFFIDGLDEYEGATIQDDDKSLVDLLCNWTTIAPNTVKLCVSSREYNVFMNAFPADKRMRLHELTRRDMEQYVSGKIGPMDNEKARKDLTETIVDNAHGIFLWVALVVRRMRELIENGRSADHLKREVAALPKEMEGLFAHLLDSLPESDLREAYQIFSMATALSGYNLTSFGLSALAYSFLDDYNQNPSFAVEQPYLRQVPDADIATRTESALKRLSGCCKGFVEVVWPDSTIPRQLKEKIPSSVSYPTIRFTHRSVLGFLSTDARKDHMRRVLSGFNSVDAVSNLVLAELLANPLRLTGTFWSTMTAKLVFLRHQKKLDHAPYSFFEALWAALTCIRTTMPDHEQAKHRSFQALKRAVSIFETHRLVALSAEHPEHPIYHAAFVGNCAYVRWKLTHDPAAASQLSLEIILNCIWCSSLNLDMADALDTVKFLIDQGLTPQRPTHIASFLVRAVDRRTGTIERPVGVIMTVFQHLLLSCYSCTALGRGHKLPWLGYIVQMFLEEEADPHFRFATESLNEGKVKVLRLVVGRERREVLLRRADLFWMPPFERQADSLAEFVKWFGFENEDRILQLIERNTKMFDAAAEEGDTRPPAGLIADVGSSGPATGDAETKRSSSSPPASITNVKTKMSLLIFGIMLAVLLPWIRIVAPE